MPGRAETKASSLLTYEEGHACGHHDEDDAHGAHHALSGWVLTTHAPRSLSATSSYAFVRAARTRLRDGDSGFSPRCASRLPHTPLSKRFQAASFWTRLLLRV